MKLPNKKKQMGRPRKLKNMVVVTISVEKEIWDMVIDMGFNASEICRQALRKKAK